MSYDWRELLTLAEALQQQAGSLCAECACYRSAASRAYYAAFNTTLADLSELTEFERRYNGSDHQRLRKHLTEVAKKYPKPLCTSLRGVSTKLGRLFDFRRAADYDAVLKDHEPKHLASLAVGEARLILKDVEASLTALKA